mmetsp:Transcript_22640/g.40115  ORF Transcript_22640/g.40115 Transcript_22640/m.40115 type:complete len:80 (+) Transcript_22640:739-978(+)
MVRWDLELRPSPHYREMDSNSYEQAFWNLNLRTNPTALLETVSFSPNFQTFLAVVTDPSPSPSAPDLTSVCRHKIQIYR